METFKIKENHVYLGGSDMVLEWAGYQSDDEGASENTELLREKLVTHVREKIKNYLQLDHVSFLFGTGSSIHLGAAGIQNIPKQIENDILASSSVFKEDFKKYVINLQKSLKDSKNPEKDIKFQDERGWDLIFDGTYIRNYEGEDEPNVGAEATSDMSKHYGEIHLPLELLLNYLTAILYQQDAEKDDTGSKRTQELITIVKQSLFSICNVHERKTSERDLERIREKNLDK